MTIRIRTDFRGAPEFRVEATPRGYLLIGRRGARYVAIRHPKDETKLYLTSSTTIDPLGNVWLTDVNGALEQVQS